MTVKQLSPEPVCSRNLPRTCPVEYTVPRTCPDPNNPHLQPIGGPITSNRGGKDDAIYDPQPRRSHGDTG
jgi:hypothetical protein